MATIKKTVSLRIRTTTDQISTPVAEARLPRPVPHMSSELPWGALRPQQPIALSSEGYDALIERLEMPAKELPKIFELFSGPSVLEADSY